MYAEENDSLDEDAYNSEGKKGKRGYPLRAGEESDGDHAGFSSHDRHKKSSADEDAWGGRSRSRSRRSGTMDKIGHTYLSPCPWTEEDVACRPWIHSYTSGVPYKPINALFGVWSKYVHLFDVYQMITSVMSTLCLQRTKEASSKNINAVREDLEVDIKIILGVLYFTNMLASHPLGFMEKECSYNQTMVILDKPVSPLSCSSMQWNAIQYLHLILNSFLDMWPASDCNHYEMDAMSVVLSDLSKRQVIPLGTMQKWIFFSYESKKWEFVNFGVKV